MSQPNSAKLSEYIIGIDWGSSSFRAYLLGNCNGVEIIDTINDQVGIIHHSIVDHEYYLNDVLQGWLLKYKIKIIIMTGMIGSNAGMVEVPYQNTPITLDSLAEHVQVIKQIADTESVIIPGLSYCAADGNFDVMRGEETQVFGASAKFSLTDNVFCLPGTHSKWLQVTHSKITRFSTYLTGELMYILSKDSILASQLTEKNDNSDAFLAGLDFSKQQPDLLHSIFQVRVKYLMKKLSKDDSWDFLRGLCIGSEFIAAKEYYKTDKNIYIIGSKRLSGLYQMAGQYFGLNVNICQNDITTAYGLWIIAESYLSQRAETITNDKG